MGSGRGKARRAQQAVALRADGLERYETDLKELFPYFAEGEPEIAQLADPLVLENGDGRDGLAHRYLMSVFYHAEWDAICLVNFEEGADGKLLSYATQFVSDEKTAQRHIRKNRKALLEDGYSAAADRTNVPIGIIRKSRAILRRRYLEPLRLSDRSVSEIGF